MMRIGLWSIERALAIIPQATWRAPRSRAPRSCRPRAAEGA
jgi:hypothetical protein